MNPDLMSSLVWGNHEQLTMTREKELTLLFHLLQPTILSKAVATEVAGKLADHLLGSDLRTIMDQDARLGLMCQDKYLTMHITICQIGLLGKLKGNLKGDGKSYRMTSLAAPMSDNQNNQIVL